MIRIQHLTGELEGEIQLPLSKSISNRALIIQSISGGKVRVSQLSDADDTIVLHKLLSSTEKELHCGEGGTTLRFLLAALALKGEDRILMGSERLSERPLKPLVNALNKLGAAVQFVNNDGKLPVQVHPSSMHGGVITIEASQSSQFVSALMMIAPALDEGIEIHLQGEVASVSYLNMTAALMRKCGVEVTMDEKAICIEPGEYREQEIAVEPDWSAASYWLEAAALSKKCSILLKGLSLNSIQGDAAAVQMASHFGVKCREEAAGLYIEKEEGYKRKSFMADFSSCPDLVPAFAMAVAGCGLEGRLSGISTLKNKESDRSAVLHQIIEQTGGKVSVSEEEMLIDPFRITESKQAFEVFNDHRIAMCLAPLALKLREVLIRNPEVVTKSYPGFWNDCRKLGFQIEEI